VGAQHQVVIMPLITVSLPNPRLQILSGLPRPAFNLANTDRAYGQSFTFVPISVSTTNLKASLLGDVASTHGNYMAQRTIFPNVSCAETTCTVAPPIIHVLPPSWFMLFVLDSPMPSSGVFVRISSVPVCLSNQSQGLRFGLPGGFSASFL